MGWVGYFKILKIEFVRLMNIIDHIMYSQSGKEEIMLLKIIKSDHLKMLNDNYFNLKCCFYELNLAKEDLKCLSN